jgi:hypothetical protein
MRVPAVVNSCFTRLMAGGRACGRQARGAGKTAGAPRPEARTVPAPCTTLLLWGAVESSRAPVQGGSPLQSAVARELTSRLADPDSAKRAIPGVKNCFDLTVPGAVSEYLTRPGDVKISPTIVWPGKAEKRETGTGRATTGLSSTEAGSSPGLPAPPPRRTSLRNKKSPAEAGLFLLAGARRVSWPWRPAFRRAAASALRPRTSPS